LLSELFSNEETCIQNLSAVHVHIMKVKKKCVSFGDMSKDICRVGRNVKFQKHNFFVKIQCIFTEQCIMGCIHLC
jgi:hypothetical protein